MSAKPTPAPQFVRQGMGPIQVIPPGLTGLLQLKQTGELPDTLSKTVVPVIELRDWYLTARRQTEEALFGGTLQTAAIAAAQFANVGVGGVAPFAAVPQNQIWYIEQMSASVISNAAADVWSFAIALVSSNGPLIHVSNPVSDYVGTRIHRSVVHADRGFWAYPGDAFIVDVLDVVSAGLVFGLQMRATPCPI